MRMHLTRSARFLAMVITIVAALALATPSAHAQDYPGGATFATSDSNPVCGTSINLTGEGFAPSTEVTLTVGGQTIGTVTTDASGNFTFPWTVPCSQIGSITVVASDGTTTLNTALNVRSATTTTTTRPATPGGTSGGSSLPRTGSDSSMFIRVGVLLLTVGGLLVLGSRKRSRKTANA